MMIQDVTGLVKRPNAAGKADNKEWPAAEVMPGRSKINDKGEARKQTSGHAGQANGCDQLDYTEPAQPEKAPRKSDGALRCQRRAIRADAPDTGATRKPH